jgi:AhpD family alkylhydroperoxidase
MTTTENTVHIPVRLDFDAHAAAFSKAMSHLDNAATKELDRVEFDPKLRELVRIRASQINGCAYCVDTHTADARKAGVSGQRVDLLPVWEEAPVYTAAERAAFALVESVVRLHETHVPAAVVEEALAVLGEAQTAAVLGLTVSISAWNQIGVTSRCWPVALREE